VAESIEKLSDRVRELERAARRAGAANGAADVDQLVAGATDTAGARVLTVAVEGVPDAQALLDLADRLKGKLGDAAIVLGRAGDSRVDLVVSVAPALVARGVRAGEIVKVAAAQVGGGGGGRDTLARAGGRDPDQLPAAISAARTAIEAALSA
jgi:alanyl-tRNA synthetase